jgi:predicted PurR-regulated permease PerM
MSSERDGGLRGFTLRVLIVLFLGALAVFLWQSLHVVLLLFGAILLAVILRGPAELLSRWTGVRAGLAVVIVAILLIALLAVLGWAFGAKFVEQADRLIDRLPSLLDEARHLAERLGIAHLIPRLGDADGATAGTVLRQASGLALSTFGFVGDVALVIVAAAYIAAAPQVYQRGFIGLLPPSQRVRVREALAYTGIALHRWLVGQVVCMLAVGTVTAVGLTLLGVESALALGVLAGFLEFIPFLGPIMAALPAVLLAFSQDPDLALYVGVQAVENYALFPLVQKEAVDLPPALALFAIAAFGTAFGILGAIYAAPLTVIAIALTQKLYQEDVLGDPAGKEPRIVGTKRAKAR